MVKLPKKKAAETTNQEIEAKTAKTEFTKEQLLTSEKFRNKRDLINAILADDEKYSVAAVEEKIKKFMKGQVK